eukprot:GHVN01024325.1.p1 GENE.GHVN01024325.1~~GHVN01024325.1.p1  ORF type:complete len:152 (+),score=34.97 GHVN01024325.1:299-754(+)
MIEMSDGPPNRPPMYVVTAPPKTVFQTALPCMYTRPPHILRPIHCSDQHQPPHSSHHPHGPPPTHNLSHGAPPLSRPQPHYVHNHTNTHRTGTPDATASFGATKGVGVGMSSMDSGTHSKGEVSMDGGAYHPLVVLDGSQQQRAQCRCPVQ